ncbi:MAG: dephospho-CoA kinase [Bavariicoccus seileri]|uniref:dephospho-CoA kinase n=1 Tax=Bavariicoccus seileri TaxID=549685 RepID=UPI003F980413
MSHVIGITGGIATGKSLVTSIVKQYPLPIIDADQVARQVVEPGKPALKKVAKAFGPEAIAADGTMDRAYVGKLIFSTATKREQLNQILGPIIREEIESQINHLKAQHKPLIFCDIPLLYESHYDQLMDEVWVVWVPEDVQVNRLMARDQITKEQAEQKMASQWPLLKKKERADWVIDNRHPIAQTQQIVTEKLDQKVREFDVLS